MRVSLGLLSLCLALCYGAPAFEEGKTYLYDYEARFGSGISDNAVTQLSGRGLKGQLRIQYSNKELTLQYVNLKAADFNKRLPNIFDVVELNYQDSEYLRAYEQPFWAEYQDGRIIASKHSKDSSYAEINPKRALLSILQTIFPQNPDHEHFYNVKESGIGGACATTYVISHQPYENNPGAIVLNVTKNRHYDKCDYRPHHFFSSLSGSKCAHCKEDSYNPYKAFGRTEYQIRGTKQQYTIERIENNGLISFTPFTTNGQTVLSLTNQTLRLVNIEAGSLPSAPADTKRYEGLSYIHHDQDISYNTEAELKQNYNYLRKTRPISREQRFAEAEKYLQPIDLKFSDYPQLADNALRLGYALYHFDYEDLELFFKKNINLEQSATPGEKDRRRFVFKILSIVGTNPTVSFLLDLIQNNQIPDRLVGEVLSVLPFYVKTPSQALVERYRRYVESDPVNADPHSKLYSVTYLSYGSVLYKACVHDDFNPHPYNAETYISKEKCSQYVQSLIERFRAAPSNEQKCILLRAIRNTRSEEAYQLFLTEILPPGKYNSFIRGIAVFAFQHYITQHRDQIVENLVPILSDVDEDYAIRIYAFDVLLIVGPTPLFFANLVVNINKESNQQVSSYIYSTLASIANSTDPCYEDVSKHARSILPFIQQQEKDIIRYSNNRFFSFYNEKYGFGRTTQLSTLASNDTAFPREVYLRHAINFAGYNFDALELGIIQRGAVNLDNGLAILLGKYNLLFRPKIGGEDYNLAKHLNFEKITSNAIVELYSYIFNQEVFTTHSFDFKESPYHTEIGQGKYDIHYTKVISSAQIEHSVPNELGLRTSLFVYAPVIVKLQGTIQIAEDGIGSGVDLDLQYGFDAEIKSGIEVFTASRGQFGYSLTTNAGVQFPIRGNVKLDLQNRQLVVKEIVSTEPYDLLHYKTTPSTYIEGSSIPVQYSERPVQRQYKFGHNYFGAGLKFQLAYDYYWNDYGSYRNFFKTFFHKSSRYEDYFDLIDKYYAGSRGFLDYAILNPTARPFEFHVRFEQSSTNPATEYIYSLKKRQSPYYDEKLSTGDQAWTSKGCEVEIVAKGPVERKWNIELTVDRHWPVNDLRRLNFHFRRSALPNYDEKPYEVCLNSEATVSGLASIVTAPFTRTDATGLTYSATLNVGENCGEGSRQITFRGAGKPSEEQTSLDKEKLPIYQKCKEDYQKGYEFSYACWLVRKDQGRVDNFILDIEYSKNINPAVKSLLYRIYLWARHTFYNNLQVDQSPNTNLESNQLRIKANFSYAQPVVDIRVYRPHETVSYRNVYVPSIIPRYEPITISEPFFERYVRRLLKYQRPLCILSGDYVYTLDGVVYKYQLGNCYHVAVADSLSEDILVLYKRVQEGQFTKALKVIVYESTIEIKPEGGALVAYVDGEKIDDSKPAYIKLSEGQTAFAVYRKFNGYVVSSKPSGLEIYFDGRNSKISVSNLFRGRQNGLCGNFNGEKRQEFRAVDGTLYKSASEFAHSYAIHKADCHPEK